MLACPWCAVHPDGQVTDALLLGDGPQSAKYTWVGFSSKVPGLLAVGTDGGRVMLYAPATGRLTSQKDGKHPGKNVDIVAGDCARGAALACKPAPPCSPASLLPPRSVCLLPAQCRRLPGGRLPGGRRPWCT